MNGKRAYIWLLLAVLSAPLPSIAAGPGSGAAPIPPGEAGAKAALEQSPRHHEWASIAVPGKEGKVSAFIAYPERKDKAPVVIVIMEIYGLTDRTRKRFGTSAPPCSASTAETMPG
ncbi:MAG: hypothetical protein HY896_08765 [Deltaproteobacteria bacterium]|nr:hypothetical protein [Deltaproteobacteria bacterium]